jgi:hypothetical protein
MLSIAVLCTLTDAGLAQQPPAFEVASIKRNTDPMPRISGTMPNTPKGEIRLVWMPARFLVLLAYPLARERLTRAVGVETGANDGSFTSCDSRSHRAADSELTTIAVFDR